MDIEAILKNLTLEEKAGLCSGADFWHTKAVERMEIPQIMVSDGPHGLRKMEDNAENPNQAIKAVCFPSACATACSFDRELLGEMGKALGEECQAENLAVLLGPGCNIKRSPLCGRNFEYFSEDPYLASQMAISHIKGVQSKGVGTSLKHFAANNQENRRMSVSAEIDERTLHEIYLAAFEPVIKEAKPRTVMCSYNKINGEYSSQNKMLLTDILRDKWGYDGLVVSDWGAVDDRAKGIKAGLDLEMPGSMGKNDQAIIRAVEDGSLSMDELDACVRRILKLIDISIENRTETVWDKERHHKLAKKIAVQSAVLLKNEKNILPLFPEQKIAFIGAFAEKPRYQGGGSSHINSFKTVSALEAVKEITDVTYARGFDLDKDEIDPELEEEAIAAAMAADVVVVFAGLPEAFESEGYDRKHMQLPDCQLDLIDKLAKVNRHIVVVLHNGSPVELPFAEEGEGINTVQGILEMYLGGQAVGEATVDLLFGKANPCGKLAETFPLRLEDNPSYLNFPGEGDRVRYAEGIFVGYRYYDKKNMEVRYPFGYGLSYTTFEYSDIKVSAYELSDKKPFTVECTITNTGDRDGAEIVQLYIEPLTPTVIRPIKELKGFEKVFLKAGESRKIVFRLDKSAFSYYSDILHDWLAESGEYNILIGESSQSICLEDQVHFNSSVKIPVRFTLDNPGGDIKKIEEGFAIFKDMLSDVAATTNGGADQMGDAGALMALAVAEDLPLHAMISFTDNPDITRERLQMMIDQLNARMLELDIEEAKKHSENN
ncbi:MAG: glycoside hydrolase family 3 C-terminal domain-containing protein [Ruminococcus sp.]|nr:glycoside hydrolase family 3 C-terminal domain-containing protein [Ruminococcus sp.]